MIWRQAIVGGASGLTFFLALAPAIGATASEKRGKIFAERNCAPCHAIGKTGKSKLPKALPLRTLSKKYKLESLEEAFAEGIAVNHRGQKMPEFELDPDTIDDLIGYIKSISGK